MERHMFGEKENMRRWKTVRFSYLEATAHNRRTWNGMIHDVVSGERSQDMKITVDENSRVHVDIQKY